MKKLYMVTVVGEEIVEIIFLDIYLTCVLFPDNMLLMDFSPPVLLLYLWCLYPWGTNT